MTAATPFVSDSDFTLYVGDVRDVLATLDPGSVDCCITSPPYWGLRDYGTGQWEGGDPDCDHAVRQEAHVESSTLGGGKDTTGHQREGFKDICPRCGAARQDRQLGLEASPEEYVANMVAVFREVRRVLADHGTCWLNLGDSYNNRNMSRQSSHQGGLGFDSPDLQKSWVELKAEGRTRMSIENGDLKEKDLVGIPWMVAFALRADGWYLRSDIIWSKPNPMPESVTDRPTKSHEYVFLLSKQPRYFFDQEAVREKYTDHNLNGRGGPDGRLKTSVKNVTAHQHRDGERWPNGGRNIRTVWEIATQPYAEAHFATYPEKLVERCLLAGCPEWVCGTCGTPWERAIEVGESDYARIKREQGTQWTDMDAAGLERGVIIKEGEGGQTRNANGTVPSLRATERTVGRLEPRCRCHVSEVLDDDMDEESLRREMPILRPDLSARAGLVLDPFMGSGTTALVARKHGRRSVGVELNPEYADLAARRLQQLSLLAVSTP